jgi:hypothetical protein
MVYIYTENLFALDRAKDAVKKLLGRQIRGPRVVFVSLVRGLKDMGKDFCVNSKISAPIETACVLSGAKTLKWAISQKQKGNIKKIIAGPNIVVFPDDEGGVLRDPLVDIVIAPGLWVKELYSRLAPELAGKIRIWPAGVLVPKASTQKKDLDFLVYDKTSRGPLFNEIIKLLQERKFNFKVLAYGKFRQEDYFGLLERSKFEIYLSRSESQGLAMFEAWIRDVPTLVWEAGEYENKGVKITGQIGAPFLSPQTGSSFTTTEDFKNKLDTFINTRFSPRQYSEENFTDKICAQKYLDIIYEA